MSESWRKLGLLYSPRASGQHPKLVSHAANPLAMHIAGDIYRIFFSGRDETQRSSVGAVDVDIVKRKVMTEYHQPLFEHGPPESFYSHGVSIGGCYEINGVQYMLFMGWQRPVGQHWRGDIGRLIVNDDLTLRLDNERPLMGSDSVDPVSLSYPWVYKKPEGGYAMWYGSTVTWDAGNDEMLHVIHHASSLDGNSWLRRGIAVPYELGFAQAFSRPTVALCERGGFEMWFSFRGGRGKKYRIGYARSDDGENWILDLDRSGIDVSTRGWDCEMIEYPFVFDHAGARYMLYNGNGYGSTGFGLAVLE